MTTIQDITFNIMQGEYDDHLTLLTNTIRDRHQLAARLNIQVGDTVEFTADARPKYLKGALATVTKVNPKSAKVSLMKARGRFSTHPVTAPFTIIKKVDR